MICAIRIRGMIGLTKEKSESLHRLRLRRKYSCIVLDNPSKEQIGMIKSLRNEIAFGEISEDTYNKLVETRGEKDSEGKRKPFFRLHPPRGGAKTKVHFPKGILGDNKEKINDLVLRML